MSAPIDVLDAALSYRHPRENSRLLSARFIQERFHCIC